MNGKPRGKEDDGNGGAEIYYPHGFRKWSPRGSDGAPLQGDHLERFQRENGGSRIGENIFFIGGITNVPAEYFQRHIEFLIARMWNMWFGHNKNPALALLDTESELGRVSEDRRAPICYNIDQKAVEWSDLIIADVSVPSTGTGQELERAAASGKPIILMVRRVVRDMEVKPLRYYAETQSEPGREQGDVVGIKTLPGLGGVSPMVQGNPNVVAVIVYDDENSAMRKLSTVMSEVFDDTHLYQRRKERLEEDRRLFREVTKRYALMSGKVDDAGLEPNDRHLFRQLRRMVAEHEPSFEQLCVGINVPDRHFNLLRMKPEDAIKALKRELKDDFKYMDAAKKLFDYRFSLRHPDDIRREIIRPGDPEPRQRVPPVAADGIIYSHIRITSQRPSYPPTFPERARRDGPEMLKRLHKIQAENKALKVAQSGAHAPQRVTLDSGVVVEWSGENMTVNIPSASALKANPDGGVSLTLPMMEFESARQKTPTKQALGGLKEETLEKIEEIWRLNREKEKSYGGSYKRKV